MYWTDIHTTHDIDDDRIAEAFAATFDVSTSQVAVTPRGTQQGLDAWDRPGLFALIQHECVGYDPGYDFPVTLAVGFRHDKPSIDDRAALETFALNMGQAIMSDIEADGLDTWRLFWPDGTSMPVFLDDDDNVILSPTDRDRLIRIQRRVAA